LCALIASAVPGASYRDASEVAAERRRAALERAQSQRRELTPNELARLPPALREELERLEPKLEPADASASAVLDAEEALDAHARLLVNARAALSALAKRERRQRHDRALEKIRKRLTLRPLRRALLSLVLVVLAIAIPAYVITYFRMKTACRRSIQCRERGQCVPNFILTCAPGSSEDCARSEDCRAFGWCSAVDGQCWVAGSADCQRSEACTERGECTAFQGSCVQH
jgi:hypothetical protein